MDPSAALPEITLRGYRPGVIPTSTTGSDLDRLVDLDTRCFAPEYRFSRSTMRRLLEARNAIAWIAERADDLAGFAIASRRGATGYLQTIDVDASCRRQGIASLLMSAVERSLQQAGAKTLQLHVSTRNAAALRFYERQGYVLIRTEPLFYGKAGGDALLLAKPLA